MTVPPHRSVCPSCEQYGFNFVRRYVHECCHCGVVGDIRTFPEQRLKQENKAKQALKPLFVRE